MSFICLTVSRLICNEFRWIVDLRFGKKDIFLDKLEIRISKYETMTEIKNVPMTKTLNFQWVHLDHFVIWYSNLFRPALVRHEVNITPSMHDYVSCCHKVIPFKPGLGQGFRPALARHDLEQYIVAVIFMKLKL